MSDPVTGAGNTAAGIQRAFDENPAERAGSIGAPTAFHLPGKPS
ncbi:hypothetical protein [Nonomuraea composti]|nr:hypothetical protein [Nonomuraea sp. FMUSA5-5]